MTAQIPGDRGAPTRGIHLLPVPLSPHLGPPGIAGPRLLPARPALVASCVGRGLASAEIPLEPLLRVLVGLVPGGVQLGNPLPQHSGRHLSRLSHWESTFSTAATSSMKLSYVLSQSRPPCCLLC